MITVQLNRADFEYDIHSLVKAFYPAEDVKVCVKDKTTEEEISFCICQSMGKEAPGELSVAVTNYLEKTIEIAFYEISALKSVGFKAENKCVDITGIAPRLKQEIEVDFTDRKDTKNRLKQTYYKMLCEFTGKTLPWGDLTGIRPTKIPMAFLEEGKDEAFIRQYMKDTYFASDEKIDLSIDIAKRELELLKKIDYENGYSLYIGIPFCPSTCLYCSFTSYPLGMWKKRIDEYLDALEKEIDFTAERFKDKYLNAVYIGGGTPTTLEPYQLRRLIRKIKASFDLSNCLEFTVEAGRPDSITREKLEVLREEGIDRISINPQTMKDETLKIIGRHHTVEQAVESFKLARELGFDNINMDLIIGLPNENIKDVEATMQRIKELDPDNLTIHSLALKRAARLNMFREEYQDLTFENTWETVELTASYAAQMGLEPYYLYRQKNMAGNFENVGYAKPGKAGIYNILIMEEKQTIMALGAGATTKFVFDKGARIERVENVKDVTNYLERTEEMIAKKIKKMEEISWH
ncbi:MAG: coproporphyrinogen dehydrogenase HemZ [Lachnospiraceae bacterium]|nr:coproporphyrinogen dehydrogenase HemZ [Lachnospiraceae bacterium]